MMVRKGDIVRLETSGGGGFGDPRARDAALVERDVRHGYVSDAEAVGCAGLSGHRRRRSRANR